MDSDESSFFFSGEFGVSKLTYCVAFRTLCGPSKLDMGNPAEVVKWVKGLVVVSVPGANAAVGFPPGLQTTRSPKPPSSNTHLEDALPWC